VFHDCLLLTLTVLAAAPADLVSDLELVVVGVDRSISRTCRVTSTALAPAQTDGVLNAACFSVSAGGGCQRFSWWISGAALDGCTIGLLGPCGAPLDLSVEITAAEFTEARARIVDLRSAI